MSQEFDVTKQFQKSVGKLLNDLEQEYISAITSSVSIDASLDRLKSMFKHELWSLHDIVSLNIELIKSKQQEDKSYGK